MYDKLNTLKTLVDFVNNNAEIDDDLTLTLNSLQIMIITNTSEKDFGFFIKNNSDYPLISNLIRDHLYLMKLIKATEDSNEGIYKEISQFDHIGCEDLRSFKDAEFESIIPEGETDKYYNYLVAVCYSYGVLEYKSQDLVMDNIIYLENKLVSRIEKVPYNDKFTNLDLTELYELYGLHLVIMRIIRSFLNDTAIPKLTKEVMNSFRLMIILCLVSNIVIEIVVMILIECLISQKLLVINTKVGLFSYFLE